MLTDRIDRTSRRGIGGAWNTVQSQLRNRFDGPLSVLPATPEQISESVTRNASRFKDLRAFENSIYHFETSRALRDFWKDYIKIRDEHAGRAFFLCFIAALSTASPKESSYPDPIFFYQEQQRAYLLGGVPYASDLITEELVSTDVLRGYSVTSSEQLETLTRDALSKGHVLVIRQRVEFPHLGIDQQTGKPQQFGHLFGIKQIYPDESFDPDKEKLMICGDLTPYGISEPYARVNAKHFFEHHSLDIPTHEITEVSDKSAVNVYVYSLPVVPVDWTAYGACNSYLMHR